MRLPELHGLIRRRILVNFRVDPEVMQAQLPSPFRVKTVNGMAIAGICLIRLEQMKPGHCSVPLGMCSENAAHRIAVQWDEEGVTREGVFVPRRDTNSRLSSLAGGRLFPGDYRHASFQVCDENGRIDFHMRSDDGEAEVKLIATEAADLKGSLAFASLTEASCFFEAGALGFSPSRDGEGLDGMELETTDWRVTALSVSEVYSSYFASDAFPKNSVEFDCALLMRDIPHSWKPVEGGQMRQTGA
jgi:uncharacterized protein YqjF (DUF2071 family)